MTVGTTVVTNEALSAGAIGEYLKGAEAKSHRWMASAEERLWELASARDRRAALREVFLHGLTKGQPFATRQQIRMRGRLLQAPDTLWDRVDAPRAMPLSTAVRLLARARALAKRDHLTVPLAVERLLEEYDRKPVMRVEGDRIVRGARGHAARARAGEAATGRGWWLRLGQVVANIVDEHVADGDDELVRHEMAAWLGRELRTLAASFALRVEGLRRTRVATAEIGRGKLLMACRTLHMDAPRAGKLPDMKKAKAMKYRLARSYHPDANGGDASMTSLYEAVLGAYEVLAAYSKQKGT